MKKNAPLVRAARNSDQLSSPHYRWKFSAIAAAALVTAGFYTQDAAALSLGRIAVQSALGEPLRAEIELPQITAAEADSLRATTATPEVFRAQGMEYTPAMNSLQIRLQRRPDGSAVLRLTSDRPVNDPFLDLVLDANWGTGRIVRSYTMLFDPPALRRPAPTVTASPQISAPPAPVVSQAPVVRTPVAPRAVESAAPAAAPAPRPAVAAPRPAPADSVTVRAGDTAGRIASANRPAGVSLDQMLVAMVRANPNAFIQGNVNRVKAGAVLQLPDQATAQAVPQAEARQVLTAQARDFNEFRRKLAGAAPATEVAAAQRVATGTVQTQVEDKKPATAAPDKLTLSKGSVAGQKQVEDQVAKAKQADDAATRMAELSKNITDLNKLGAASAPATGATGSPAATAPVPSASTSGPAGIAVVSPSTSPSATPAEPAVPAPTVAPAASAPVETVATAASAPNATQTAASEPPPVPKFKPTPTPAPVPADEPGLIDGLMEDPLLPLGAGLLLALLLGLGAYRVMQRRRQGDGVDSSFLESRIQPDSFFGASGGQRVDTANSETTGSSMAYSPSQLDAGGDVDPVAEADVYLAYGRDLQAEEILKEALRHNPARTSVHVKLAEIYAKRQDRKALEAVGADVFKLTQGEGPDWARIVELGNDLDPENRLYQPGGRPVLDADDSMSMPSAGFPSTFTGVGNNAARDGATPSDMDLDLDFDLDLDLPEGALTDAPDVQMPNRSTAATAPPVAAFGAAALGATAGSLDLDLDRQAKRDAQSSTETQREAFESAPLIPPSWDAPQAPEVSAAADTALDASLETAPGRLGTNEAALPELDFPSSADFSLAPSGPMPLAPEVQDSKPMEFDLGELSLDLNAPVKPMAAASSASALQSTIDADDGFAAAQKDPLETKLALADEFKAIGDTEGARTLVEEVVAEASGALKARAQAMLADLD